MANAAYVKPPCPNCDKGNEFVFWDNEKHRFFCWRNPSKQKYGCGHIWSPAERAQPQPQPAPVQPPLPQGPPAGPPVQDPRFPVPSATAAPQNVPRVTSGSLLVPGARITVFLGSGPLIPHRVFAWIDPNNNLHCWSGDKAEVVNGQVWSRIEFE